MEPNKFDRKKYIFLRNEINPKEVIPLGIEDFQKLKNTNYWTHYCYSKIIEHSFSKKTFHKKRWGGKKKF